MPTAVSYILLTIYFLFYFFSAGYRTQCLMQDKHSTTEPYYQTFPCLLIASRGHWKCECILLYSHNYKIDLQYILHNVTNVNNNNSSNVSKLFTDSAKKVTHVNDWQTRNSGAHLKFQHLGGRVRRITSLRPVWAT
jgi:hypothetical protein